MKRDDSTLIEDEHFTFNRNTINSTNYSMRSSAKKGSNQHKIKRNN